jgi:hypothetical protein
VPLEGRSRPGKGGPDSDVDVGAEPILPTTADLPPRLYVRGVDGRTFRAKRSPELREFLRQQAHALRHARRLSNNAIARELTRLGWPISRTR